jgi:hypothetical protein
MNLSFVYVVILCTGFIVGFVFPFQPRARTLSKAHVGDPVSCGASCASCPTCSPSSETSTPCHPVAAQQIRDAKSSWSFLKEFSGDSLSKDNCAVFLRLSYVGNGKRRDVSQLTLIKLALFSVAQSVKRAGSKIAFQVFVFWGRFPPHKLDAWQKWADLVMKAPNVELSHWLLQGENATNRGSNLVQFEMGLKQTKGDNPFLYFVEDDYFHLETAVGEMIQFSQYKPDAIVFPVDYVDRYLASKNGNQFPGVSMGDMEVVLDVKDDRLTRHWRRVTGTTMTFAMRLQTWLLLLFLLLFFFIFFCSKGSVCTLNMLK